MMSGAKWKFLRRRIVFLSKFLSVYQDRIKLPNGNVINDYTVVRKPDSVIIVATSKNRELVTIREYRYAANNFLTALPSGYKEKGESAINAAKRELLEETGYGGGKCEEIGFLYEDSAKSLNKIHVVTAKEVYPVRKQNLEAGETISQVKLLTLEELRKQIRSKQWKSATSLAALAISGHLS